DVVKLFPATAYSPKIIKDLKAPLPNLEVMPTGGVGLNNLAEWIRGGAFACGVGGSLLSGIKEGDYAKITRTAKEFVRVVEETNNG
ncbi:MAG: bifunctional 2-keto-4-hydroxyglutarate aldolase/2-keto-3-deoxy-6-phosphogluconate aldolase, partial [Candidatus Gallimonas sp.]